MVRPGFQRGGPHGSMGVMMLARGRGMISKHTMNRPPHVPNFFRPPRGAMRFQREISPHERLMIPPEHRANIEMGAARARGRGGFRRGAPDPSISPLQRPPLFRPHTADHFNEPPMLSWARGRPLVMGRGPVALRLSAGEQTPHFEPPFSPAMGREEMPHGPRGIQQRGRGGMAPLPRRGMAPHPGRGMAPHPGRGLASHPGRGMAPYPGRGSAPHPGRGMAPHPGRGMPPFSGRVMPTFSGRGMPPFSGRSMPLFPGRGMPLFLGRGGAPYPTRGMMPFHGRGTMPFRGRGIIPARAGMMPRGRGGRPYAVNRRGDFKQGTSMAMKIFEKKQLNYVDHPWMTDAVKEMIKSKHLAEFKFKRTKNPADHAVFKELRNKVNIMLREAKAEYAAAHPDEEVSKSFNEATLARAAKRQLKQAQEGATTEPMLAEAATDEKVADSGTGQPDQAAALVQTLTSETQQDEEGDDLILASEHLQEVEALEEESEDEELLQGDGQPTVLEEEQSVVEEEQSVVEEEESVVEEEESVVIEEESVVEGEESVVEGEESVVEEEESVVEGEESVVKREESVVEGEQSVVEAKQSVVEEIQSVVEKEMPVVKEKQPVGEGEQPAVKGKQSVVDEDQLTAKEGQLSAMEGQLSAMEGDPSAMDVDVVVM